MIEITENDPYVGEVYTNILDQYDSPTYNLKLFMVRRSISDTLSQENIFNTQDLRDAGGQTVRPEDIVVLAQTGVTASTTIDDLEIQSQISPDIPRTTQVSFSIAQAGAATFLDQVLFAKKFLGYDGINTTVYLEINFRGYQQDTQIDGGDAVEGGAITKITKPTRYKLVLTSLALSVNAAGSQYECMCIPANDLGYRHAVYETQQVMHTVGTTVREHLADYETKVNNWHQDKTGNDVPDRIIINTDLLVGTDNAGQDSKIVITDDRLDLSQIEEVNRMMNEDWDARSFEELFSKRQQNPETSGTAPEAITDNKALNVAPGTNLEQYLGNLLSMVAEMYSLVSRRAEPEDPNSPVDKGQGFITWFKVKTTAKEIGFDKKRGTIAYEYTYTPVLYKTARNDIALGVNENNDLTEDDRRSRLLEWKANNSLIKSYNYLFTGLNDQVIDLDISYDTGIALLIPPNDGIVGDYTMSQGIAATSTIPENTDATKPGVDTESINAGSSEAQAIANLDNLSLSDRLSVATSLGALLDRDPVFIANRLESTDEIRRLVTSLDQGTIDTIAQARTNLAAITAPTDVISTQTNPDGSDYTPEFSGYQYAADFIPPSSGRVISAESLVELGYITLDDVSEINLDQQGETAVDVAANTTDAAYKLSTPRNKLWGVLTRQHAADNQFLIHISLTLRGDPWYLGSESITPGSFASNSERANFKRDDNLFWLRLAAPITYDPDWRDEDSALNSGYWKYDGTSYTFSGIYRMITVINKFSGGVYTCELTANRVSTLTEPVQINDQVIPEAERNTVSSQLPLTSDLERPTLGDLSNQIASGDILNEVLGTPLDIFNAPGNNP